MSDTAPKWQTGEPPLEETEVIARTVRGSGNLYVVTRNGDRGWFSRDYWGDYQTHPWVGSWEWFDPATPDGQASDPKPAPTYQTGTPPGTATLLLIRHGSGALPTLARKGSTGVWVGTDPRVRPGMSWEGIEWMEVTA